MNWSVEDRRTHLQTLFYWFGLIVLIFGFFRNLPTFLIVGLFFILLAFFSEKYLLHMARHLLADHSVSEIRLSVGESSCLTLWFSNDSRLPLISLHGHLTLDPAADFPTGRMDGDAQSFSFTLSIPARRRVRISCPVRAVKRGIAKICSLELICEDPLHIYRFTLKPRIPLKSRVIVYPLSNPVFGLKNLIPGHPGFTPSVRSLFRDDAAPSGARDYLQSDPFRHIHWKASARLGRLQTKTFEKTAQVSWTLVFLGSQGYRTDRTSEDFERRMSAAAFITEYACRRHYPFDIYCNNKPMGRSLITGLEENQGPVQLRKAWELFALMQKWQIKTPADQAIRAIDAKLTGLRTIFIIDLDRSAAVSHDIRRWVKKGHTIYRLELSEKTIFLKLVTEIGGAAIG